MRALKFVIALSLAASTVNAQTEVGPQIKMPDLNTIKGNSVRTPMRRSFDLPLLEPKSDIVFEPLQEISLSAKTNQTLICALAENRPYGDLLGALENLSRSVAPVDACKGDPTAESLFQNAKDMKDSIVSLHSLWKNPESLKLNPEELTSFQNHFANAVGNFQTIANNLGNSKLFKAECGRYLRSNSSLLLSLSDFATSLAPYALMISTINPAWGLGVKAAMGLTGVGSISKVFANLSKEPDFKMDLPENRRALLLNICEFSKVSQRVRFLKLLQSGQIDVVTKEIQALKSENKGFLGQLASDRVSKIANIRNKLTSELKKAQETLKKDQFDLRETELTLSGTQDGAQRDDTMMCMTAKALAEKKDTDVFPLRAAANFKSLIELQTRVSLSQSILRDNENRFRTLLAETSLDNIEKCAQTGRSYMETLKRLVAATSKTLISLQGSLDSYLKSDKEYSRFEMIEDKINREAENLTKITDLLQKLNQDNAVMDKSELHIQMANLKTALFGSKQRIVSGTNSPVGSWLKTMDGEFEKELGRFDVHWNSLKEGAFNLTESGKAGISPLTLSLFALKENSNYWTDMQVKQTHQFHADTKVAEELRNITEELAPVNSLQNKVVCKALENAWLSWAAALDHLAAQNAFCEAISDHIDPMVDKTIHSRCASEIGFSGQVEKKSTILTKQSGLETEGYKQRALIVSQKMKDLQCKMPDASAIN